MSIFTAGEVKMALLPELRVPGKGEPGQYGGAAGDLVLTLRVLPLEPQPASPPPVEEVPVIREPLPGARQTFGAGTTRQAAAALVRTLTTDGRVYSVAFSPDGQTLASGSVEGFLRSSGKLILWNTETGEIERILTDGRAAVFSTAFSPDGRTLASGTSAGTVNLWDAQTGALRGKLPSGSVFSLGFSPDGNLLATGTVFCEPQLSCACLWHAQSGEKLSEAHAEDWLTSVAFSPDGGTLATAIVNGSVDLRDVPTMAVRLRLDAPRRSVARHLVTKQSEKHWIPAIAYSPNGRMLAVGGDESGPGGTSGKVTLWDLPSGESAAAVVGRSLVGHRKWVTSVAFSPDRPILASGSLDTTVKLWDTETGELQQTLEGHRGAVLSVAFSPEGDLLATAHQDGRVEIWRVR